MRFWFLPISWAFLIFLGSSIHGGSIPAPVSVASQALHACEYAVLAYLIVRALQSTKKERYPLKKILVVAFTISVLYAATDEFHQFYIPGRHPDPLDLLMDALGSGAGVFLWYLFVRRRLNDIRWG